MTRLCEKVVPAASVIPLKSSLSYGMIKGKKALCFWFWFFVIPSQIGISALRKLWIGTRKGI